jgi:amino acid transporter
VILLGTLVSTFGYMTGDVLTSPRALYALAEGGLLPPAISRVHPVFRTPYIAIVTHAVLVVTLAATGSFATLIVVANVAVLLMYGIVAASVLMLRRKDVHGEGAPFVVPGGLLVPVAAIGVLLWLLSTATKQEYLATGITLAVATALHLSSRFWRSKAPAAG